MSATTKATLNAKRGRQPKKTAEDDPWLTHDMSSHIPNAETQRALKEEVIPLPEGGLAELWNEE